MTAWFNPADQMPPLHQQVLVELKDGPGQVCDVACYVGRHENEDRWVLADVRLDTRGIRRWAHIYPEPPENALREAFAAGLAAGQDGPPDVDALKHHWQEYNR